MAAAWKLWDGGDKLAAKKAALAVLASSPTDPESAQARELLARLRTPPFAYVMAGVVAGAAILLGLLAQRFH